jgi:hypothetical protein
MTRLSDLSFFEVVNDFKGLFADEGVGVGASLTG